MVKSVIALSLRILHQSGLTAPLLTGRVEGDSAGSVVGGWLFELVEVPVAVTGVFRDAAEEVAFTGTTAAGRASTVGSALIAGAITLGATTEFDAARACLLPLLGRVIQITPIMPANPQSSTTRSL